MPPPATTALPSPAADAVPRQQYAERQIALAGAAASATGAALAAVFVPLSRASDAEGSQYFDWSTHTPANVYDANVTAAYWLGVASRLLGDPKLALSGLGFLGTSTMYQLIPIDIARGTGDVLTAAAATIATAAQQAAAAGVASSAIAEAMSIRANLLAGAQNAQVLADGTTFEGKVQTWIARAETWAKVGALALAAAVAGMLGWGAYRIYRRVRG